MKGQEKGELVGNVANKDAGDMCVRQLWQGLQHDFVAMYPLFAFVRCAKKIQQQQQQQQQQINTAYKIAAPASNLQKKNNNNQNNSYNVAPFNPKYNGSCRKNLTFFRIAFAMTAREERRF